jgi:hypothetical protein
VVDDLMVEAAEPASLVAEGSRIERANVTIAGHTRFSQPPGGGHHLSTCRDAASAPGWPTEPWRGPSTVTRGSR